MNVYEMQPVCDNPLYEGLALFPDSRTLETYPKDWKKHQSTWESTRLKPSWQAPEVEGQVRLFNDYPCLNLTFPAFSGRAVDLLREILEANGELLPVRHKLGVYYFFNCTRVVNAVDVENSSKSGGGAPDIGYLKFFAEKVEALELFKDRSLVPYQFCTQRFVDRVHAAGLQGFVFLPVWPLPPGLTYHGERYRIQKATDKWKPNALTTLEIQGNTIVLRLCCQRRKVTKGELAMAETVMKHLEQALYDPAQATDDSYFGSVEGSDTVESEIRIFISTPDNERLLRHLMPSLRTLPWPGKFYVVKRRGEFMDGSAAEEYVAVK